MHQGNVNGALKLEANLGLLQHPRWSALSYPLTIIAKRFILAVAAVLDPPLVSDNMHSGILPLNKETLELLVRKHPEPRETSPDILIQGPTRPPHPVAYDGMDESVIMKASISMLTKGGFGPSGLDADGCCRILTFRALGTVA